MVVHVEGAGDTDVLGRKRGSYLNYVNLWIAIMHPTKLKVSVRGAGHFQMGHRGASSKGGCRGAFSKGAQGGIFKWGTGGIFKWGTGGIFKGGTGGRFQRGHREHFQIQGGIFKGAQGRIFKGAFSREGARVYFKGGGGGRNVLWEA